jgi:hypothetical protein
MLRMLQLRLESVGLTLMYYHNRGKSDWSGEEETPNSFTFSRRRENSVEADGANVYRRIRASQPRSEIYSGRSGNKVGYALGGAADGCAALVLQVKWSDCENEGQQRVAGAREWQARKGWSGMTALGLTMDVAGSPYQKKRILLLVLAQASDPLVSTTAPLRLLFDEQI